MPLLAQRCDERGDLLVQVFRPVRLPLIGGKVTLENILDRGCIAQRAPKDSSKRMPYLFCQHGGKRCLANTSDALPCPVEASGLPTTEGEVYLQGAPLLFCRIGGHDGQWVGDDVTQQSQPLDLHFHHITWLEPAVALRTEFQDTACPTGARAEDVARTQAYMLRSPLDELREGEVDVPGVGLRELVAVDAPGHAQIIPLVLAGAEAAVCQFIWCHQPWAQRCGEVLALERPHVELHLFALQVAGAPVVHHHVARDVARSLLGGDIMALTPDDRCDLQFEIQFTTQPWIRDRFIWAVECAGIREVEDGKRIPLGDHAHASSCTCRFDVLFEGIAVAEARWIGQGRAQPN